MKKKFDPFKNLQLDAYEQEIEDAIERGDVEVKPISEAEKKRLAAIASYTLGKMKKEARINVLTTGNQKCIRKPTIRLFCLLSFTNTQPGK